MLQPVPGNVSVVTTFVAAIVPVLNVVIVNDAIAPTLIGLGPAVFVTAKSGATPVTEPLVLSPVDGAGLPAGSVPCPVADQAFAPATAVNVQVKSADAPAASVVLAGVKEAQLPPPVTFTA